MLGLAYLNPSNDEPHAALVKAGGAFGILAAFAAWYNALAGIADSSNRFVPRKQTSSNFASSDKQNVRKE